jgi:flagellar hook assembly protein FlgD
VNIHPVSSLDHVNLEVYDLSGRLVQRLVEQEVQTGAHIAEWIPDASVPTGCYLIRLVTSEGAATEKCVHLR